MGKKVTYTSTRSSPQTPWYYQTEQALSSQSWNDRLQFMIANPNINSSVTSTDTTLTSIVTFSDSTDYTNFSNMTQGIMNDVIAYCNTNGITYEVVVEDI